MHHMYSAYTVQSTSPHTAQLKVCWITCYYWRGETFVSTCSFFGFGYTPTLPQRRNSILVHLKLHSFNLKCSQWYIFITCLKVLSWSLPSTSCHTISMLSAMPNTFGISVINISSVFPWIMSPQMVVWWICTCQTAMERSFGMKFLLSLSKIWLYIADF